MEIVPKVKFNSNKIRRKFNWSKLTFSSHEAIKKSIEEIIEDRKK